MNNKETELYRIVDRVVECCAMEVSGGKMSVTCDDVLGRSRAENVVMTRCILVGQIIGAGYSASTAAMLLGRTVQDVRHILQKGCDYRKTSRAYRIADAEATLKCKELL